MKRREFIGSAATTFAALSASPLSIVNEKQNAINSEHKTVVSVIQSEFTSGSPESNPYHPNFDIDLFKKEIVQQNIDNVLKLLNIAGERKSDIALTTEDIKGIYSLIMDIERPELLKDFAETIPGNLTEKFGAIAKKYNMYIITSFIEKDNNNLYNSAVLLNREGKIEGVYRKVQLPVPESWVLTPGNDFPVFKTDFANIGIAICYDMIFPEIIRILALNGADMIFIPTGGYGWTEDLGESMLKVRAADNMVWIAMAKSSTLFGAGRSAVVNPLGQIIADAGYEQNYVLTTYIDPKSTWIQPETSYGSVLTGVPNMRLRLNLERRPEIYKTLIDKNPKVLAKDTNLKLIHQKNKEELLKVVKKLKEQYKKESQIKEDRIGFRRDIL
jgi:predicted amidohydrolase